MKKIISLYGLPACGKTTQAEKLAKKFGFYQFGMGDKIRAEIKAGTELGQKIKAMNDQGILVPDELMIEIIKNCGRQAEKNGIVFDGFPRIISQAKMLDMVLAEAEQKIDAFFILKISRAEAINRINQRATLTGRADDKDLEVINNRLGIFNEQSAVLIDYYRTQGKFIEIDGEKNIEEVFLDICGHLE
ncbi:MAG TPA: adenylate kinase [Candidatus Methylomirabilis sp.]|nr:adenylate kinase [Candidatus Methylomirabilis sp.]